MPAKKGKKARAKAKKVKKYETDDYQEEKCRIREALLAYENNDPDAPNLTRAAKVFQICPRKLCRRAKGAGNLARV
ncbi:hypothetical protein OCU04_010082 [Sclerotinia nivalis]|uniref:Uncharacterized protein n=1 Tax=Sclerotinia nivalis TaxID=352851 RepID=A0A9X0ADV1_9HELO|nr:hypothetical protein OCU04_010082 [Sclerotinia nivalis]